MDIFSLWSKVLGEVQKSDPQYYEVIEGLEPGEQVIVSGYEAYKDNDVLVFN